MFVLIARIVNPISLMQLHQCNVYYFRGSLNTASVIFNYNWLYQYTQHTYIAMMMTVGEWCYSDHRTVKSTTANGHSGVGTVCVHVPITSCRCDSPVGRRPWSVMTSERTILCYVRRYITWEKRKLKTLTNNVFKYLRTIL